jgi:hypothetical protein
VVHGVTGHRDGLGERGFLRGHRVGDDHEVLDRRAHPFGEGAGPRRHRQDLAPR